MTFSQPIVSLILQPLALAFGVSLLITPLVIKLARVLGVMDDPTRRAHPAKLHRRPVPRGGGIPIFLAIAAASLIFLPLDGRLAGILLGTATLTLVGIWDDRRDLNPYLRLAFEFLAAGFVVASGIGIAFISNPAGGIIDLSWPRLSFEFLGEIRTIWVFSVAFGFLWIVALMNFVSWSSGVDGQLSGFTAIAALVLAALSLRFSADITQWPVTILAAATAGAYLGFLPYHLFPQKIMPGFGGGTLAGFMLAVLAILTTTKVGTLLVVLAIPILDAGFVVARRVISGKSPVWADNLHLHHRLLAAGWSKRKVAAFYWLAAAILGALVLNLNTRGKLATIVAVGLTLGAIVLWLGSLRQSFKQPDRFNG